jgi:hypothetical protein
MRARLLIVARRRLPQPRFSDIRRFCEIDGWEETKGTKGKAGDHFRYRKTLSDGRILRTKASHSNEQIGDPSLWRHIWRDQLGLESEDQFWEALATGEQVDRTAPEPAPSGPSLPAWLVNALVRQAGVPFAEVAAMSEEEARERLNEFYSRPTDE